MGAACERFRAGSELSRVNAAQGNAVRARRSSPRPSCTPWTRPRRPGERSTRRLAARWSRPAMTVTSPRCGHAHATPRPVAGWPVVELRGRVVRVPRGVTLDLGATAKAFAADRAASRAASAAGCGVLAGLGGDIAVSGPAPADGWRVRVCDDHRAEPNERDQTVTRTRPPTRTRLRHSTAATGPRAGGVADPHADRRPPHHPDHTARSGRGADRRR